MQHTFHLRAGSMTPAFVDRVRKMFGDKELRVIIEDIEPRTIVKKKAYDAFMALREQFKEARIDPNIDISKLADDVNL